MTWVMCLVGVVDDHRVVIGRAHVAAGKDDVADGLRQVLRSDAAGFAVWALAGFGEGDRAGGAGHVEAQDGVGHRACGRSLWPTGAGVNQTVGAVQWCAFLRG